MRISNQFRARITTSMLALLGAAGAASAQDLSLGWAQMQGISNLAPRQGLHLPEVGASHLLVSVGLNVLAGCLVISEPLLQVSCGDPSAPFRLQRSGSAAQYPLRGTEGGRAPVGFGVDLDF